MPTDSSLNITPTGTSPVATFTQTQTGGTVFVQQSSIVDPNGTGAAAIGAAVDLNGLHVVLQQGTPNASARLTNASIAANASATLVSGVKVTSGKTGTLQQAIFAATGMAQWDVETVDNASAATIRFTAITPPGQTFDFKPAQNAQIASVLASTTNVLFQVICTNLDTQPVAAYATFWWAEN